MTLRRQEFYVAMQQTDCEGFNSSSTEFDRNCWTQRKAVRIAASTEQNEW